MTNSMSTAFTQAPMSRAAAARQFLLGAVWILMSAYVAGSLGQFIAPAYGPLANSLLEIVLLLIGFSVFATVFDRGFAPLAYLGFPRRATTSREGLLGIAIGWGMVTAVVLPMVLVGALQPEFDFSLRAWNALIVQLLTAAAISFAAEIAFRGYAFQRLADAVGEAWATVAMVAIFGIVHMQNVQASIASTLTALLFAMACAIAYLRTRALWLSWGLHFAWLASAGILFGLPVDGDRRFNTIITANVGTPFWFTGGFFGPASSVLAPIVLIAGIAILVLTTRDYAWEYTYRPIEGAGYPMEPPPPPEHARMEEEAKAKIAALVQIAPANPPSNNSQDFSK
ncbi:MAG: CPBP family intramembrane metalloprotease [Acidobacteria bacterium]|nr:CPBP family intramembrane metalloprotease [Acidobacteriota bacterium]